MSAYKSDRLNELLASAEKYDIRELKHFLDSEPLRNYFQTEVSDDTSVEAFIWLTDERCDPAVVRIEYERIVEAYASIIMTAEDRKRLGMVPYMPAQNLLAIGGCGAHSFEWTMRNILNISNCIYIPGYASTVFDEAAYAQHVTDILNNRSGLVLSTYNAYCADNLRIIGTDYALVLPTLDRKAEFIQRWTGRANNPHSIKWDDIMGDAVVDNTHHQLILGVNQFLDPITYGAFSVITNAMDREGIKVAIQIAGYSSREALTTGNWFIQEFINE